MKLLAPLPLQDVQTTEVTLVPTKKFFKPVVVLSAPLTKENAEILNVGYLFDPAGNPHSFEGSHRLTGELSGASLVFVSKQSGQIEILTEKIASMGCAIEEKTGMRIKLHAHLPESQPEFLQLLDFLAKLNKEKFDVTVREEQASLFEGDRRAAQSREVPFATKIGIKEAIAGRILTQAHELGGYIGGWECRAAGLNCATAGGQALHASNPVHAKEPDAFVWACDELLTFVRALETAGTKELRAQALLIDWIMIQAPSLKKSPEGRRTVQSISEPVQ